MRDLDRLDLHALAHAFLDDVDLRIGHAASSGRCLDGASTDWLDNDPVGERADTCEARLGFVTDEIRAFDRRARAALQGARAARRRRAAALRAGRDGARPGALGRGGRRARAATERSSLRRSTCCTRPRALAGHARPARPARERNPTGTRSTSAPASAGCRRSTCRSSACSTAAPRPSSSGCRRSVRPISAQSRYVEIADREGRGGPMVIATDRDRLLRRRTASGSRASSTR